MYRLYHFVGPVNIKARVAGRPTGNRISSAADLLAWVVRVRGLRGEVAEEVEHG